MTLLRVFIVHMYFRLCILHYLFQIEQSFRICATYVYAIDYVRRKLTVEIPARLKWGHTIIFCGALLIHTYVYQILNFLYSKHTGTFISLKTVRVYCCKILGNLRTFRHVTFITPLWNGDSVLYQKSLGTEESSGNFRRAPEKRLGWAQTDQSRRELLSQFCSTNRKRPASPSSQSGATLTQAPIYTAAGPARPQSHRKYHSKLSYLKIYTKPNKENANLRQDPHGQDHHPWGGALWHHRKCQGQDPGKKNAIFNLSLSNYLFLGQGGHPPGPAEVDLCWQAARRRKDPLRLQHPEGVHPPSRSPS